ncbi:ABC transporter ATP-binding protein [Microaceticoccus formicicus]|uniref:ABC transporter ATP-binding protein n=1 Tax=Microaceticoccus formicicus TaxID=3118105 RepID=UPI003CD040E8|nr:ATP-binding cassette domain-containing protein [Peptoniphilaceae bacterium AMB_02]
MSEIKVINAYKKYGSHTVLTDINLEFESGKIYGIIGRNGSGKTVLLKSICGLIRLTSGEVHVNGKVVGKDIDFPEEIGLIIETPGFLMNYTGVKNLQLLAEIKGKITRSEIEESIKRVGLDPKLKKNVGTYSMGMKQRLGIAQAIMEKPDILLLDEPMNGLDNDGVKEMRELFTSLKEEGVLMLLCSHNPDDIKLLCDHVYEIDKGIINQLY